MTKTRRKPGDIVKPGELIAYRRRPRNKDEILCHNHVLFNGFRWFSARRGGWWRVCPCGWRPELGVHYANADFVKHRRDLYKKLGSREAVRKHIARRVYRHMKKSDPVFWRMLEAARKSAQERRT